jgi:two-component system CheB/CheR fusion protein
MTACCYGVQIMLDRQRRALEEARESAVREGQLRSAGRMAAEFAHQIKNPLTIINNATYSLKRALAGSPPETRAQLEMIQEEVERSDQIITQIMDYAQLTEGRVEKLSVTEELERATDQVLPAASHYPIRIHRDYGDWFPPLLMQRRHLEQTFVNLLQNAREALGEKGGNIFIRARSLKDYSIEVAIGDDGPGIPADQQAKIFEPYFTTREKGTGLGLAMVKHNVELYGGSLRVESALGKGARFVLVFPARTLIQNSWTS